MTKLLPGIALALLCAGAPAQAALTLCNRTSTILYAATAAGKATQTQVQGWTRIAPGDCQQARSEDLTAERIMVYARSSRAHAGAAKAWGGKISLCVKDTDFRAQQNGAVTACKEDGAFALPFAALNTGGKQSWAMTLDESPALPSLPAAQLAGVKRLLRDNGQDTGPLDGAPDKKTGAALAAFRKKMNLDKAGNAELFTALEREALKHNAPAGYTICNDGKAVLEAAMAQTDKQKTLTHGWWTVPPGACARALTTPLPDAAYYLFARQKGGEPVATGPEKFCTLPTAFEIKERGNCAARGQGETGFARTPTNGQAGFVARIGEKGLIPGGAPVRP